jgi:hypothetical protein
MPADSSAIGRPPSTIARMRRLLAGGIGIGLALVIVSAAPASASADCLSDGSDWYVGLSITNQSTITFQASANRLQGDWANQNGARTYYPPTPIPAGLTTCGYAVLGSSPFAPSFPIGGATWSTPEASFTVQIAGPGRVTCAQSGVVTCELGSVTGRSVTRAYLALKDVAADTAPPTVQADLPPAAKDDDLAATGPPLMLTASEPNTTTITVLVADGSGRNRVRRLHRRLRVAGKRHEISPRLPADEMHGSARLIVRLKVRDLAGNARRVARRLQIRH